MHFLLYGFLLGFHRVNVAEVIGMAAILVIVMVCAYDSVSVVACLLVVAVALEVLEASVRSGTAGR